jgi:hypothetical protein
MTNTEHLPKDGQTKTTNFPVLTASTSTFTIQNRKRLSHLPKLLPDPLFNTATEKDATSGLGIIMPPMYCGRLSHLPKLLSEASICPEETSQEDTSTTEVEGHTQDDHNWSDIFTDGASCSNDTKYEVNTSVKELVTKYPCGADSQTDTTVDYLVEDETVTEEPSIAMHLIKPPIDRDLNVDSEAATLVPRGRCKKQSKRFHKTAEASDSGTPLTSSHVDSKRRQGFSFKLPLEKSPKKYKKGHTYQVHLVKHKSTDDGYDADDESGDAVDLNHADVMNKRMDHGEVGTGIFSQSNDKEEKDRDKSIDGDNGDLHKMTNKRYLKSPAEK